MYDYFRTASAARIGNILERVAQPPQTISLLFHNFPNFPRTEKRENSIGSEKLSASTGMAKI